MAEGSANDRRLDVELRANVVYLQCGIRECIQNFPDWVDDEI
jgi:hypothetical protein